MNPTPRYTRIPPYYHPTTVCFVDDNYGFLHSLSIDLPEDWCFVSYLSPEEALAKVNKPHPLPPLVNRCFSMDTADQELPMLRFDIHALEREIQLIERFARFSVLMIDYAMPTMDGLEFCAAVQGPDVKKILLTGVADEKTAVAAFNESLIDRYVPKARLSAAAGVIPYVEELQFEYFQQYSGHLAANLALNPPRSMLDAAVAEQFERVVAYHNIVEYYLVPDPYGYLLLKRDGSMLRLIVQDDAARQQQLSLMIEHKAPENLISAVRHGDAIFYPFEHPEHYLDHESFPWEECVFKCQHVAGQESWFLAIAEDPPANIDFDPASSSFARYLELREPIV